MTTALAVLLVLLLVADRVGAAVAGHVVAGKLRASAQLTSDPSVHIRGFPFVTQALAGRYDRIDLSARDLSRGGVRLSRLDTTLVGARIGLRASLSGAVRAVPVEGLTASAVVTYADVASRGIAGLSVEPLGDGVKVTGRVTVLGQSVTAASRSDVRLEGRTIVVTARTVEVLGRTNGLLNRAIAGKLDLRIPVGTLPYGLLLTGVRVTRDGLVLAARTGPAVLQVR